MASRATKAAETGRSQDREMSRTPPSTSSESSPPPSHRLSNKRSRSRSRSLSPSRSERRVSRRKDDTRDRERDRARRRSGRDFEDDDDDEADYRARHDRRSSQGISIRGTSHRPSSLAPDDAAEEDDARSVRSHPRSIRRGDSRDPDDGARVRRRRDDPTDADRSRRHRSARQDSYDGNSSYYGGSPAPSLSRRDRDYDRERDRFSDRRRDHERRHAYDYYAPPPPYYRDPYAGPPPDRRRGERRRRRSPSPPPRRTPTPEREDYELRSVFCSQLAARLTQRDLGEFFEEKLGEDTVRDVRIVSDRVTGRSKGIGYVELVSEAMVERAIAFSGEVIFGIPILIQKTEAARNRGEGASTAQAPIRPNLPGGIPAGGGSVGALSATRYAGNGAGAGVDGLPVPPHLATMSGNAVHLQALASLSVGSKVGNPLARLYVGNLYFELKDTDVRDVFGAFGEIEEVDLHREPTGKSKGFAFVQFKRTEDANQAISEMNGFELAGRKLRVGHCKGSEAALNSASGAPRSSAQDQGQYTSGDTATLTSAFDEGGGGGLNAQSRANLMQMLARGEGSAGDKSSSPAIAEPVRPSTIPQATSRAVLLKNMFNPEE